MDATIITTLIASITSVIIALINNRNVKQGNEERKMFAAKQAILQMISEDYIAVELRQTLPSNHSRVLYEYDIYKKHGGNSDIDEKLEEYGEWYSSLKIS
ncbi:MAG: hypothetical protein KBT27_02205 [Prevotellaceae bacterium]|nr:hypothetical protein [Candidatus Faecinaster equi]